MTKQEALSRCAALAKETCTLLAVHHPGHVKTEILEGSNSLINISVHERDMRFVLGTSGRNAQALRTLLIAQGRRFGFELNCHVVAFDTDLDR